MPAGSQGPAAGGRTPAAGLQRLALVPSHRSIRESVSSVLPRAGSRDFQACSNLPPLLLPWQAAPPATFSQFLSPLTKWDLSLRAISSPTGCRAASLRLATPWLGLMLDKVIPFPLNPPGLASGLALLPHVVSHVKHEIWQSSRGLSLQGRVRPPSTDPGCCTTRHLRTGTTSGGEPVIAFSGFLVSPPSGGSPRGSPSDHA